MHNFKDIDVIQVIIGGGGRELMEYCLCFDLKSLIINCGIKVVSWPMPLTIEFVLHLIKPIIVN